MDEVVQFLIRDVAAIVSEYDAVVDAQNTDGTHVFEFDSNWRSTTHRLQLEFHPQNAESDNAFLIVNKFERWNPASSRRNPSEHVASNQFNQAAFCSQRDCLCIMLNENNSGGQFILNLNPHICFAPPLDHYVMDRRAVGRILQLFAAALPPTIKALAPPEGESRWSFSSSCWLTPTRVCGSIKQSATHMHDQTINIIFKEDTFPPSSTTLPTAHFFRLRYGAKPHISLYSENDESVHPTTQVLSTPLSLTHETDEVSRFLMDKLREIAWGFVFFRINDITSHLLPRSSP